LNSASATWSVGMKLIIQNIGGSTYAYFEDKGHHKVVEKRRGGKLLDPLMLNHECDLSAYPDSYFVIDVKKPKKTITKLRRAS
jgi:hypothetical protein